MQNLEKQMQPRTENITSAMESGDHLNGASSKSHTSRVNFLNN
jgi:hypothetical protein